MPRRLKYRLDLSALTDEQFLEILEKISGFDGFDEPVVGVAKNITVLWLSDKPIEEALDIPIECIHPL
jgi:hypothetical protein